MNSSALQTVLTFLTALALLASGGCRMASVQPHTLAPAEGLQSLATARAYEPPALTESLFPEDQAVLGNEAVRQLLDSPVYLAAPARLAAVRFGNMPSWWGRSEEFARTSRAIDGDFIDRLRQSDRLTRVAPLPTLLVPHRMTIPFLREAAVRFQCDLLLVYRTTTGTFTRERFWAANEVRAFCTVEGVLIDVRTGTIPFSATVTEHFEARQTRDDTSFTETVSRATQQAIGRAWLQLAAETADFLDAAPRPPAEE